MLTVPPIGIVVALPAEARTVVRQRLEFESLHKLPGGHWLTVSGAGPENAHGAASRLLDHNVEGLMSWGCAAAIAHHLLPGQLVLPEVVLDEEGHAHAADSAWLRRLSASLPSGLLSHGGHLMESARVVGTRAAKASLHTSTGAIAVDMESGAIARIARARCVPFLAVRAIADSAAMDVPRAVSRALNPRGDVRTAVLLAQLALHPLQIGELIALGRAFGAALRTLYQVRRAAGSDFRFIAPPEPR